MQRLPSRKHIFSLRCRTRVKFIWLYNRRCDWSINCHTPINTQYPPRLSANEIRELNTVALSKIIFSSELINLLKYSKTIVSFILIQDTV